MTPLNLINTSIPVGTHFGVWKGYDFITDKSVYKISRSCAGECAAVVVNDEHGIKLYNIYDTVFARSKVKLYGLREGVYFGRSDGRLCWIRNDDGEVFIRIDLKDCAYKLRRPPVEVIIIHRFPITKVYRKEHI